MRFCNNIIAKVLAWLACLLVPAESLPLMTCDCGNQSSQPVKAEHHSAEATPVATCPHCNRGPRILKACCRSGVAISAQRGSCCGANGTRSCCCCKGGKCSHNNLCLCSQNGSAPTPVPMSSDSHPGSTKSLDSYLFGGPVSVVVVVQSETSAFTDPKPMLLGSNVIDRLSILCRLVI